MQKNESKEKIRDEIKQKIAGYIAAAFGLVAGLAWNDAIKSLIEYLFPIEKNTLMIKFSYAILISAVVVVATIYIARIIGGKKE